MGERANKRPEFFAKRYTTAGAVSDEEFYRIASLMAETKDYGSESKYYAFGYQAFGPILYGFCKWMAADLREQGIERILFFARDGYIIQRAFELLPERGEFRMDYLYVSRRSLCVPQLWAADVGNRLERISMTKYITVGDFLTSVGLEKADYVEVARAFGLQMESLVKDEGFVGDRSLRGFLDSVWPDVARNSKREYDAAVAYLGQFGLAGRVAVVDIGWRGSIQKFLESLLGMSGADVRVRGYYLALNSDMHRGLDMRGYLLDMDASDPGCDLLRGCVGLAEMMFPKPEGSVEKYSADGAGGASPVLCPYEYADGRDGLSPEAEAVAELQRGALDFVREYVELGEPVASVSSEAAFRNLLYFAYHPTREALDMFGWFRFFNNGSVTRLAGSNAPLFNLARPAEMKRDLYGSRWRVGFLKRQLVVPLPYGRIFNCLMRAAM